MEGGPTQPTGFGELGDRVKRLVAALVSDGDGDRSARESSVVLQNAVEFQDDGRF